MWGLSWSTRTKPCKIWIIHRVAGVSAANICCKPLILNEKFSCNYRLETAGTLRAAFMEWKLFPFHSRSSTIGKAEKWREERGKCETRVFRMRSSQPVYFTRDCECFSNVLSVATKARQHFVARKFFSFCFASSRLSRRWMKNWVEKLSRHHISLCLEFDSDICYSRCPSRVVKIHF